MNDSERPRHLRDLPVFLRAPRAAGLWLVGALIAVATVWAFAASYHGLFDWAIHHRWPTVLAAGFPFLVDLPIVVCEVILFVAAIDGDTPWRVRGLAWVTLLVFTAASIVANADHIAVADWPTRAGFGLPPLVLAIALGFGLGELKRQAAKYREDPDRASAGASAGASARPKLPPVREIQARRHCSQATAEKVLAELRMYERGRGTAGAPAPATHDVPAAVSPEGPPPAAAGAHPNGRARV